MLLPLSDGTLQELILLRNRDESINVTVNDPNSAASSSWRIPPVPTDRSVGNVLKGRPSGAVDIEDSLCPTHRLDLYDWMHGQEDSVPPCIYCIQEQLQWLVEDVGTIHLELAPEPYPPA